MFWDFCSAETQNIWFRVFQIIPLLLISLLIPRFPTSNFEIIFGLLRRWSDDEESKDTGNGVLWKFSHGFLEKKMINSVFANTESVNLQLFANICELIDLIGGNLSGIFSRKNQVVQLFFLNHSFGPGRNNRTPKKSSVIRRFAADCWEVQ